MTAELRLRLLLSPGERKSPPLIRAIAGTGDPWRYRNIYVQRNDPPVELMRRAESIISHSRASPEMDDATAQTLRSKSRELENANEAGLVQQLARDVIPAMGELPDRRLAQNAERWFDHVPIPLDPRMLAKPPRLPRPNTTLTIGHSETAFTGPQLGTMDLLVDDTSGRSYAVPDQTLRFPFLCRHQVTG